MVLATAQKTTRIAANRGSGRRTSTRWFHVVTGGYESIYAPDGEPLSNDFVLDGFNVEVADGGHFGWGTRDAIEAAAREQFPHRELVDFWPLSCPPVTADEF